MSYWNLYWVESDGYEDCFVVARNSRSACRIECNMNGFEPDDLIITKVMRIPQATEKSYNKNEHPWPWYVYGKEFFETLGAQFRIIDNNEEMLLQNVVYGVEDYAPCCITRKYSIGKTAFQELDEIIKNFPLECDEEDIWDDNEQLLLTMMGMCLVRCQQIEQYVSHSFILGAISPKQKKRYKTINDLVNGWKKKTFGNMLISIEEAYDIEPTVHANFKLFLEMRNRLIHDVAISERCDIKTSWGGLELASFLKLFDVVSLSVKRAFRSSFYASIHYATEHMVEDKDIPEEAILTEKQIEEIDLFAHFFIPKIESK